MIGNDLAVLVPRDTDDFIKFFDKSVLFESEDEFDENNLVL